MRPLRKYQLRTEEAIAEELVHRGDFRRQMAGDASDFCDKFSEAVEAHEDIQAFALRAAQDYVSESVAWLWKRGRSYDTAVISFCETWEIPATEEA